MTDNEIIKALKCCVFTQSCAFDEDKFYCHHGYSKFCDKALLDDALSLINRQEAEIEDWQGGYMTQKQEIANLEIELKAMRGAANSYKAEIERLKANEEMAEGYADALVEYTKAEAYKEFAERLKNKLTSCSRTIDGKSEYLICDSDIDNLLKELVGENK